MQKTELEDYVMEALGEEMPNLIITTNEDGQIVIETGKAENAEGEVIDFEELDTEYESEEEDNEEVADDD